VLQWGPKPQVYKLLKIGNSIVTMSREIEKKYLIRENEVGYITPAFFQLYQSLDDLVQEVNKCGKRIRQGYLPLSMATVCSARLGLEVEFEVDEVRLRDEKGTYYLTLKSKGGLSRSELEKEISSILFKELWSQTTGKVVEKLRLKKAYRGYIAEIDLYTDRDLIVIEIEFATSANADRFSPLGRDVSNDAGYKNKNLAK